jgi:hypothetical protein
MCVRVFVYVSVCVYAGLFDHADFSDHATRDCLIMHQAIV